MLQVVVLIGEHFTVDALAASAITSGKISALAHELGDDAVELTALVVQRLARLAHALLSGAEGKEVHRCLGSHIGAKHKHYAADVFASDLNVEECFRQGHARGLMKSRTGHRQVKATFSDRKSLRLSPMFRGYAKAVEGNSTMMTSGRGASVYAPLADPAVAPVWTGRRTQVEQFFLRKKAAAVTEILKQQQIKEKQQLL